MANWFKFNDPATGSQSTSGAAGSSAQTLKICAPENKGRCEKNGTCTVVAGSESKVISIHQDGAPEFFSIKETGATPADDPVYSFSCKEGEQYITFESNKLPTNLGTIVSPCDWVSFGEATDNDGNAFDANAGCEDSYHGKIKITVTANTGDNRECGPFTYNGEGFTVKQAFKNMGRIVMSGDNISINNIAGMTDGDFIKITLVDGTTDIIQAIYSYQSDNNDFQRTYNYVNSTGSVVSSSSLPALGDAYIKSISTAANVKVEMYRSTSSPFKKIDLHCEIFGKDFSGATLHKTADDTLNDSTGTLDGGSSKFYSVKTIGMFDMLSDSVSDSADWTLTVTGTLDNA